METAPREAVRILGQLQLAVRQWLGFGRESWVIAIELDAPFAPKPIDPLVSGRSCKFHVDALA